MMIPFGHGTFWSSYSKLWRGGAWNSCVACLRKKRKNMISVDFSIMNYCTVSGHRWLESLYNTSLWDKPGCLLVASTSTESIARSAFALGRRNVAVLSYEAKNKALFVHSPKLSNTSRRVIGKFSRPPSIQYKIHIALTLALMGKKLHVSFSNALNCDEARSYCVPRLRRNRDQGWILTEVNVRDIFGAVRPDHKEGSRRSNEVSLGMSEKIRTLSSLVR
jgi:hypothetical protein